MSYKVGHTDLANYGTIVVEDKTINTTTSIPLIGKYYPGYSKYVAEGMLHMLENFASTTSPDNPTIGQLWYNTDSSSAIPKPMLNIWTGSSWVAASNVSKSSTEPTTGVIGDLYVNTSDNSLNVYSGTEWFSIGSDYNSVTNTGVKSTSIQNNSVITFDIDDSKLAIVSPTTFTDPISETGFEDVTLKKGITLATGAKLYGTATLADALVYGTSVIDASKFFRKDDPNGNTTAYKIKIENDNALDFGGGDTVASLKIGDNKEASLINPNNITLVANNSGTTGTPTYLTLSKDKVIIGTDVANKVLEVKGEINPTKIVLTSTDSTSITTAGGILTERLYVRDTIEVDDGVIVPKVNNVGTLGALHSYWNTIFVKTINANTIGSSDTALNGNLTGTVNGKQPLPKTAKFNITGNVKLTTDPVSADQNDLVTMTVQLETSAITDRSLITSYQADSKLLIAQNNELRSVAMNYIGVPVGTILLFSMTTVPQGYLLCDGASFDKVTYAALYAVIQGTYGSSTNTFNVPNLSSQALSSTIRYYIFSGKW